MYVPTVPPPVVMITQPTSTLYAGTPGELICSVTVPTAVDVPVTVDVTWDSPITSSSTATGAVPSFTNTLNIPILSTAHAMATCRASVRLTTSSGAVMDSTEGTDTISITVEGIVYSIVSL